MPRNSRNFFRLSAVLFYLILLLPLWMWLAWYFSPKSPLNVVIVDKTVLTEQAREHASLNWILRYNRYSKENGNLYIVHNDYYGFFPKKIPDYELKGLEKFSDTQLKSLTNRSDLLYITDTYGIYEKDLRPEQKRQVRSKVVYGGLSQQDMYILKQFKKQKKLIITEFNTFSTPTAPHIAKEFEETFKIKWTGWVGRHFESLDTVSNKELPRWLIDNYLIQNQNKWPFKKGGIVFVNNSSKIIILEYVKDLYSEMPYILTEKYQRKKYNIPKSIKYSFWFDIVQSSRSNQIVSYYDIKVNERGKRILEQNGLTPQFPAIIEHNRTDYKFYYFCGDFADNNISQKGAQFKGIHYFRRLFYNNDNASDRVGFFWQFYSPLVTSILTDYASELDNKKSE